MITGIKHIAIAVADVEEALERYQELLGAGRDAVIKTSELTRQRTAAFTIGEVQYQLIQSLEANGRYARYLAKQGEGIHHICYIVDDLEETVRNAIARGANLREQTCRLSDHPEEKKRWLATVDEDSICKNCGIRGRYEHPEGWVAFLENTGVPGAGIELMQVYRPEEVPEAYREGPLEL